LLWYVAFGKRLIERLCNGESRTPDHQGLPKNEIHEIDEINKMYEIHCLKIEIHEIHSSQAAKTVPVYRPDHWLLAGVVFTQRCVYDIIH